MRLGYEKILIFFEEFIFSEISGPVEISEALRAYLHHVSKKIMKNVIF